MVHGDFKVGEICQSTASYVCATCRRAGRQTKIELADGAVFPFCAACRERGVEEVDILWNKAGSEPAR